jgi:N-glycosylase/DNA lyase
MKTALRRIGSAKDRKVTELVEQRKRQFKELGGKNNDELFKELCFCILTANYTAEGGMRIQKEIGDGFIRLNEQQLARRLRQLGHRFPNTRARYIVEARGHKGKLQNIIRMKDGMAVREWLVRNIKGLGYKEASHFLRNIGFEDFAVVDFHILDFLVRHRMIKKPKTLTKNNYLKVEEVLREIAKHSRMNLGELDLYIWYCETGKVLK